MANDDREAREHLRELGLQPDHISREPEQEPKSPSANWIATFSRQLGTLLRAGFPMDRALSVLGASSADARMKAVLVNIDEGVRKGLSLSEAIARSVTKDDPRRLEDTGFAGIRELVAMVEAGEASGELAVVLLEYATLVEKRLAFKRRLRGALFYPLIVAFIAVAVVIFLFAHVLPTLSKLFEGTDVPLPLPTRILFVMTDMAQTALPFLLVGLPAVAFIFARMWKREAFRMKLESMLYRVPWLGSLLEKAAVARWARSFGSLLSNGVDILQAMDLAARSARSLRLRDAIRRARPRVAEGLSLARAVGETDVFPPLAVEAVAVGESSGALPDLLQEMAAAWESEVETSAERFAEMLEPLVLVIMGIIVGGIVLAVLLPIFEFNSSIG